jgi:hypothetical protein
MSTIQLRNELKQLAKEIRKTKVECKEYQREHGGSDGDSFFFAITKLKYEFRHMHIALCTMRGRKYEEIEHHCSDDNKPNFDRIKEIIDAHTAKAAEDVRACA